MDERIKGAFGEIHAEEALKNRTSRFVRAQMERRTKRNKRNKIAPTWKTLSAVVACLLILLGIGGYQVYFTPTSVISIDINPSVEMEINRFDRVISLAGYTEEGETLAQSLDVLSVNYRQALEKILESETVTNCISQDELLTITVVEWDDAQGEDILDYASQCVQGKNAHCCAVAAEEVTEAHSVGLSYGKYREFLKLQTLTDDITPEEVQDMTMKELRNLIQQLEEDQDTEQSVSDDTKGNGSANGSGAGNGSGGAAWSETASESGKGAGNGQHHDSGQKDGTGKDSAHSYGKGGNHSSEAS